MLSIKRVETVVSINQAAAHEALDRVIPPDRCGRDCLGNCCIPGAKLPLYTFGITKPLGSNLRACDGGNESHCVPESGDNQAAENYFLNELLLAQWEDRMGRGLFRYDVTACETKMLPGDYGFIAQLNEGRHLQKRPTEFRVDQVLQPFDPQKFNFTKVGQEEVLFQFGPSDAAASHVSSYYDKAPLVPKSNVVTINVSPIEYGHVLLIPRVFDHLPHRIDQESLILALHMAAEANNPYFRLGYNSLGAFATINHLHFQAYYLEAPFPIERAAATRVSTMKAGNSSLRRRGGGGGGGNGEDVIVYELRGFPVRGLVFEVGATMEELARVVSNACIYLQNENIPYNVLIADRGSRVFVLPQCFAERQALGEVEQEVLDTHVNPAVWEISGHIILKRRQDYDLATEEYACKLLAGVSLSPDRFDHVKAACLNAAFNLISLTEEVTTPDHSSFNLTTDQVEVAPALNITEVENGRRLMALKSNQLTTSSIECAIVANHGERLCVKC